MSGNPQKIYFTNGSITKYVYSATGQKLRMVHYTAKANISRAIGQQVELKASEIQSTDSTDYLLGGSLVVRNGKIDKYLFDGGYAQATASGTTDKFTFYYQNKDHLGTVRETVTSTGAMKQRVNYYPFGGQLVDTLKVMIWNRDFQQYKYNGKEFDGTFGLNTYDYGARQHDPILARWDRLDPLCEKYYGVSPYAYCANNPVNAIDPDGRAVNLITGGIGALVGGGIYAYTAYCEGKSTKEIWGAAAEGAIVGGVTGLTLGASTTITASSIALDASIGALSSGTGSAVNQLISHGEINSDEIGKSTVTGAVSGAIGAVGGKVVNKSGEKVIGAITAKAESTVANARNIAYSRVEQTGAKMGGKYAKQQVNRETGNVIREAKSTASSAKKAAKNITTGKNWTVQMGIGSMANKVSEYYDSAKRTAKSIFNKLF